MTRFALSRPLLLSALLALAPGLGALAGTDPAPQTVGGERVVEIAAGHSFTCARVESGHAYCWGQGAHGQMGHGTLINHQLTPVQVQGLTGATQIVAGG